MAGDPFLQALNKCDFCEAHAYCVGFDAEFRYFECDASPANHEWSELRNPECARCGDPLPKHVALTMQGRTQFTRAHRAIDLVNLGIVLAASVAGVHRRGRSRLEFGRHGLSPPRGDTRPFEIAPHRA